MNYNSLSEAPEDILCFLFHFLLALDLSQNILQP